MSQHKQIKHAWLQQLKEQLSESGSDSKAVIITKEGASQLDMSARDIDQLLGDHKKQLRWQRRLLCGALTASFLFAGYLAIHMEQADEQIVQQSHQYTKLQATVDQFIDEVSPRLSSKVDQQRSRQQALTDISQSITTTDQAFRFFVEATGQQLDNKLDKLTALLTDAGLDADSIQQSHSAPQSSGGFSSDEELVAVLTRYIEQSSYQKLEELAAIKDFSALLPSLNPVVDGVITSPFGFRKHPISGRHTPHQGTDLISLTDRSILASADGEVVFVGRNGGFGKQVTIDHGQGITSSYAHLAKYSVKQGARVKQGERIGTMGKTGYSDGIHLHYEVRYKDEPLDPMKVLKIAEGNL